MSDVYQAPSVNQRPYIVVTPERKSGQPEGDPWEAAGFKSEPKPSASSTGAQPSVGDPWEAAGFSDKPVPPSLRTVTRTEATLRGIGDALTVGSTPQLAGLAAASGEKPITPAEQAADVDWMGNPQHVPALGGAINMLHNAFSDHPDPQVQESYRRGREAALNDKKLAEEQHPVAFLAGQLGGSLFLPGLGAMKEGTTLARAGYGMRAGAIGAGAYGANTAIGEGLPASDVATRAGTYAAIGGPLGAGLSVAVGPRLAGPLTEGQRAARTAKGMGAPLPRGVASDSPAVQATTAKLRQVPFAGEGIGSRVAATEEAAGERLGDISTQAMGGVAKVSDAIASNKKTQDALYRSVRNQIDQNAKFTMPQTRAAVDEVIARRTAAHHPNPRQGLEQFDQAANGSTFKGAHRARSDARDAGDFLNPHPGYNAGDFNNITAAMSSDLRHMVGAAAARKAGGTPQRQAAAAKRAISDFDEAEKTFGRLAERNKYLQKLLDKRGETAKVLHDLGFNDATGQFSLNKFVTSWSKMPEDTKNALFDPHHIEQINEIFGLGRHIKGALRESTTSHSAGMLVLLDVAKDAALLGADVASGGLGLGTAIGAVTTAGMWILARWLANPAQAASMGAWTKAYRGVTLGRPTPARIAAFNGATRNLAHNLNIPMQRLLERVHAATTSANPDGTTNGPAK